MCSFFRYVHEPAHMNTTYTLLPFSILPIRFLCSLQPRKTRQVSIKEYDSEKSTALFMQTLVSTSVTYYLHFSMGYIPPLVIQASTLTATLYFVSTCFAWHPALYYFLAWALADSLSLYLSINLSFSLFLSFVILHSLFSLSHHAIHDAQQ